MFRRPSVPSISVQEAHARLESGGPSGPLLVDVREPDEFAQVRVAGSVLLPLSTFAARANELPADRPLLLFCRSGNRSVSATAYLLANGYADVVNVEGGIVAWYRAGLAVASEPPRPGEGALPR